MIGLVMAAGASRRLRPDTDHLPKTLLPVDGDAHEPQQCDSGCLHIGAQHLVRVAAGEKHIGADYLRGVIGADAQ